MRFKIYNEMTNSIENLPPSTFISCDKDILLVKAYYSLEDLLIIVGNIDRFKINVDLYTERLLISGQFRMPTNYCKLFFSL